MEIINKDIISKEDQLHKYTLKTFRTIYLLWSMKEINIDLYREQLNSLHLVS